MQLRFAEGARQDFLEILGWYAERDPRVPPKLRQALETTADRIRHQPKGGAPHLAGTRRMAVRGFPLDLVYRLDARGIEVLAVAHHRRSPDYWQQR
jgi:toxin ParE1/3/4